MSAAVVDAEPYLTDIQQDPPSTLQVVTIARWARSETATERWAQLWRCAIFRSIVTHMLGSEALRQTLNPGLARELEEDYADLFRIRRRPLSIYSQLTEILNQYDDDRRGLWQYLAHDAWNDLAAALAVALATAPPLYFFVDSVDDRFDEAPRHWLDCQKGLFLTVMGLLRDSRFGNRVHVVACVRDFVLSDALQTEHANRYRWSPYIQTLWWDESSLRRLLRTKIERLPDDYLCIPTMRGVHPVTAWLGRASIRNRARSVDEDLESYLMRHTRMTPRDIVLLGNCLCAAMRTHRREHEGPLPEQAIQQAVNDLADALGAEQLRICANKVSALMFADDSIIRNVKDYAVLMDNRLREFVSRHLPRDRLTQREIDDAREAANQDFDGRIDVLSVLWQNGLLGFGSNASKQSDVWFYRPHGRGYPLTLPRAKPSYALHSCLINTLGIEAVGAPVLGFRSDRPPR